MATILKEPQFIGDMWHTNMGGLKESGIIKLPEDMRAYSSRLINKEYECLDIGQLLRCMVNTLKNSFNNLCLRGDNCKFNHTHCFHPGDVVLHVSASEWRDTYDGPVFMLDTLQAKYKGSVHAWVDISGGVWAAGNLSTLPEELLQHIKITGRDKSISVRCILEYMNRQTAKNVCLSCATEL